MPNSLPVSAQVDVLVAGGGPAGLAAAIAAARAGAKTLLVEQANCLGGVGTAGGHNHICILRQWGGPNRIVGGIMWEICRRSADEGFAVVTGANLDYELEPMKFLLDRMAAEAGVTLLYHTFYCETLVEGSRAVGAIVQNKSGRSIIRARRIIDGSGDGDAAASAGCTFEVGRSSDHACQPATLMFTIGGVDWDRVKAFRGDDWKLSAVWAKAQADGVMEPIQNQIMGWWWTPSRPDQVGVNFTHMTGVDANNATDLTRATIEGRRQAFHCLDVYRRYIPGMEKAYMISTAPLLGLRESRRIIGEVVVTEDDIKSSRPWPDSIGMGAFYIDVHALKGPGLEEGEVWRPGRGFCYQMPYRMMVPLGVDNLLVAGRCVSCTHIALGSLRVIAQCAVMGEAAGVAAAISLRRDIPPRKIDVSELQTALRAAGAILTASEADAAGPIP
ncbi:MAG: FAD-dependent oxidoreductase [Phycisphaerae bacterium]|nr:FAD-dependent oxidoreductase [Phycisphaerae bacterium]